MSLTESAVSDKDARNVPGPGDGWPITTSGSWQYLDLVQAVNRYVRIEVSEDTLMCFVPTGSTTPSTATTGGALTENLAFTMAGGSAPEQFAVPSSKRYLAVMQVTAAGVVRVHPV